MSNVLEIKQDQLKKKIGQIVPFDYVGKLEENEHVFTVYVGGEIPVRVKSKLTYKEFCRLC
ncbi:hypothetical protein [Clostridium sp. JN-1]|uniref:hypothetical protein n=1 Tax=Clostridium sp. JN-1 TaxID=2483110 RepID=UPI000F0B412D|nr:hypothetical protein [Clostridium sp. JN-1]